MFAAVVEEADIVVGQFERPDLGLDERVELVEIRLQIGGHRKIHASLPVLFYSRQSARAAASGAYLGLSTAHLPSTSRRSFASSPASASVRSPRSEEHTSELQSLMRISYAVFCLKKKKTKNKILDEN